jgi:hypothetical protein
MCTDNVKTFFSLSINYISSNEKKKYINLIIVTLKITHMIILIFFGNNMIILIDNSKTFYTDNNVFKLNFLFLYVNLCENLLI